MEGELSDRRGIIPRLDDGKQPPAVRLQAIRFGERVIVSRQMRGHEQFKHDLRRSSQGNLGVEQAFIIHPPILTRGSAESIATPDAAA